jgi:SET domain-containing protein
MSHYSFMVDDDLYNFPKFYKEKILVDNCAYINHSCEPNCGFDSGEPHLMIALKEINKDEELTYDYQMTDTEASFFDINCKCGSQGCRG